ncbi:MAG: glycoside hydrolase family 140 protein [Kiritimatiellae bacterium]|nr:glycoside hydrolase family 140 protein [Kiritimatiellia bacterium]
MKISPNGRYLTEDDGTPFFYLADTAWHLFFQAPADIETYLANRAGKGFTVMQAVILMGRGPAGQAGRPTSDGEFALLDNDPARPNEAFFRRIDWALDRIEQAGFVAALLPAWGGFVGPTRNDREFIIFNRANARAYGEYLGRRYKDRRLVWVLGGDHNPNEAPHRAVWEAMGAGLAAGDDDRHLMTYHPMPHQGGPSSSRWFHQSDWLDFNMLQTGTRIDRANYLEILADYNRQPPKPVVDGETRYENSHEFFYKSEKGRKVTAHQVRKGAYNSMLSGAMGHTYGCRDAWSFHVPSDEPPPRDVDMHWKDAMDLPGAGQMRHMKALLTKYPWYRLVPDQDGALISRGRGEDGTYVPAARAEDGRFALAYVPEGQTIRVDTGQIRAERVKASWFDPRAGAYDGIGDYVKAGEVTFTPPAGAGDPDCVLVLEGREAERE